MRPSRSCRVRYEVYRNWIEPDKVGYEKASATTFAINTAQTSSKIEGPLNLYGVLWWDRCLNYGQVPYRVSQKINSGHYTTLFGTFTWVVKGPRISNVSLSRRMTPEQIKATDWGE